MLTELKIRKIDAADGLVSDSGVPRLHFKAPSLGRGKWVFRFVSPDSWKCRDMGIGRYPQISIARARVVARLHRDAIAQGCDPLEAKRQSGRDARAAAEELTFEAAARELRKEFTRGFKNRKHKAQWLTTLESYAFPQLGTPIIFWSTESPVRIRKRR
jgi:hypothetical protein